MSQKTRTFTIRVSQETLDKWKSGALYGSFNGWVVAALEAQYELDQAEKFERTPDRRQRVKEISAAFPQGEVVVAQMAGAAWVPEAQPRKFKPDPK